MENYDYIDNRLKNQIEYYRKTSKACQRKYKIISILNIILSAIIPSISLMTDLNNYVKYVVAIIGSTSAICTSIIYFCKYKERWLQSRITLELIKSELAKYNTHTCQYRNLNFEDCYNLLVENCEQYLCQEHSEWENVMLQENKS